jgi:DNA-directed RNA polymerase specialized sigma24 family protein
MGERHAGGWLDAAQGPARAEVVDVLFRRHYAALLRLGVVMLGSREAAEDAVQDACGGPYSRPRNRSASTTTRVTSPVPTT